MSASQQSTKRLVVAEAHKVEIVELEVMDADEVEEYEEVEEGEVEEEGGNSGSEDAEGDPSDVRGNLAIQYDMLRSRGEPVEDLRRRIEREFEDEEYFEAVNRNLIRMGRGLPSPLPNYFTSLESFANDMRYRCVRLLPPVIIERACLAWKGFSYKGVPAWKMEFCCNVVNQINASNELLDNQMGLKTLYEKPESLKNGNLHHVENFLSPSVSWMLDSKQCLSVLESGALKESFTFPTRPTADVLAQKAKSVPDSAVDKLLTGVFNWTHLTGSLTSIATVWRELLHDNMLNAWKYRAEADPRFAKVVEQVKTRVDTANKIQFEGSRKYMENLRRALQDAIYRTKDMVELTKKLTSLLILSGAEWRQLVQQLDDAFQEHLRYPTPKVPEVDPKTDKLELKFIGKNIKPGAPFESDEQREHVTLGLRSFLAFGLQVVSEGRYLFRLRKEGPPSLWDIRLQAPVDEKLPAPSLASGEFTDPSGLRWGIGGPNFIVEEMLPHAKECFAMIECCFDDFTEMLLHSFVSYANNLSGVAREDGIARADVTVLLTYLPAMYAGDVEEFSKLNDHFPARRSQHRSMHAMIQASLGPGGLDSPDFMSKNNFSPAQLAERRRGNYDDDKNRELLSSLDVSSKKKEAAAKDFKMASGIQECDANQTLDGDACIESFVEKQTRPRPADLEQGCSGCSTCAIM
ncbi:unnamed protein product [Amoebophrya sp. A25]|nr:unnamed protein product [Amoebophrya sp. A25]|eukprot:GSA25T00000747001.1